MSNNYLELGDCYAAVGDEQRAMGCYDKFLELEPDNPGPYIGTGVLAFQNGDFEQARAAFSVAVKLDPSSARAFAGLAMVNQQLKNYSAAFDYYLKSLELDQNNMSSLLGLFQTSCQMGTFAKVIYYLEMYLRMHPDDVSVMFCLATLYMKENLLDKSREALLDILIYEPNHNDAVDLLEEVEHQMHQNVVMVA